MSAATGTVPPPVSWAQRNDLIYVIIDVECKDIDHKVTENSFHFKGVNALNENLKYEVTLNFLRPVEPERVTSKNIGRCLEFTIYKKESGPFWPSLTNDKTKLHFLKANFAKWKNESDDEDDDMDNSTPFNNIMGGGGGGGRGADKNMDWNYNFDDFNVDEDDDSDDNLPTLSPNDENEENGSGEEKKEEKKEVKKEEENELKEEVKAEK